VVGGPAPQNDIFSNGPNPFLSVLIYSTRFEYDFLNILLKNIDHNLPIGRVEHDDRVPGGIICLDFWGFSSSFYSQNTIGQMFLLNNYFGD
jgi:hypothetical protein